jgi:hypothetical protein
MSVTVDGDKYFDGGQEEGLQVPLLSDVLWLREV